MNVKQSRWSRLRVTSVQRLRRAKQWHRPALMPAESAFNREKSLNRTVYLNAQCAPSGTSKGMSSEKFNATENDTSVPIGMYKMSGNAASRQKHAVDVVYALYIASHHHAAAAKRSSKAGQNLCSMHEIEHVLVTASDEYFHGGMVTRSSAIRIVQ